MVCLEPTECVTLGIIHVLMSFTDKTVMKKQPYQQPFNWTAEKVPDI